MATNIEAEIIGREPILREILSRLVEVYSPVCIYLFGSKARGDGGPDSDYDLLVVLPDDAPQHLRNSMIGHAAVGAVGVPKDILVCTDTYFRSRLHLKASLPATVTGEGLLLYAA
jgi:hypothetical protein